MRKLARSHVSIPAKKIAISVYLAMAINTDRVIFVDFGMTVACPIPDMLARSKPDMTSSRQAIWPLSTSHQSEVGYALMSPRPSQTQSAVTDDRELGYAFRYPGRWR